MTFEKDNPQIVYAMLRELLDAMKAFDGASLTPKQLRSVMTRAETVLETVGAPRQSEQWTANLLTNLAMILDQVKQDWGNDWTEWDQKQRDGITAWLSGAPKEPTAPTEEKP